jgi:CxxC-x17-CxxC domain-containing protein
MSDQTLTCRDCGQQFVFTAGEQAFYTERGFSPPMRCQSCRAKRKADRNSGGGGYDSASYGGNGGDGGGYSSGPRQMYPATCAACGRETEVPFQPRGDRPVYCRDCFRSRSPSGGGRR